MTFVFLDRLSLYIVPTVYGEGDTDGQGAGTGIDNREACVAGTCNHLSVLLFHFGPLCLHYGIIRLTLYATAAEPASRTPTNLGSA
jgi:hypothetical protein